MNTIDERSVRTFLIQASNISRDCEIAACLTGENFNVFRILGLQTAEVRTHSAFLAELLNPDGCHGQRAAFLRLFIAKLGIPTGFLDTDTTIVRTELPIGEVDCEKATGGQIDIVLTDAKGSRVLIENKIGAGDQRMQLRRYHNFDKKALLIYLTLGGNAADPDSVQEERFGKLEYVRASYREHVVSWLDDCHRAAVALPVIRETIFQYRCLVQGLTHQATGDKMKTKMIDLILAHPDLADAAALLGDAWAHIVWRVRDSYNQQMRQALQGAFPTISGVTIGRNALDESGARNVISFRAYNGHWDKPATNSKRFVDLLQRMVSISDFAARNSFGLSPCWNVGWYAPKGFAPGSGIESFPKADIVSFYTDESKLAAYVAKVVKEADQVRDELVKL